jgi:hypothetical protein
MRKLLLKSTMSMLNESMPWRSVFTPCLLPLEVCAALCLLLLSFDVFVDTHLVFSLLLLRIYWGVSVVLANG